MAKALNVEKLLNSGFIDRILGFSHAYDEAFNTQTEESITNLIKKKQYDAIIFFLDSSSNILLPFSAQNFALMDSFELKAWQDFISKKIALADERVTFKEEFNSFYE